VRPFAQSDGHDSPRLIGKLVPRIAAMVDEIPDTFADIAASTVLANLCTDAFRSETKADLRCITI
jgi:hypothetical protein